MGGNKSKKHITYFKNYVNNNQFDIVLFAR
jgi:hypothetical protein